MSVLTAASQAADPLAAASHAVAVLGAGALRCGVGVLAGRVLAGSLRCRALHWSWPLAAVPVVYVSHAVLAAWWLAGMVALLAAARTGRRWHREDIDSGADLAERARQLQTPLDVGAVAVAALLRDVHARARGRGVERVAAHARDERGRVVSLALEGGTHGLVLGATGSGKTVTQTAVAEHAIAGGAAVIVVDPKGDAAMRAALEAAVGRAGRRFVSWSPDGGAVYNPYAHGTDSEIADKVLAAERFTEPHYQRQAQRYLGHEVRVLRAAGVDVSLRSIVEHLQPERLEQLARALPREPRSTYAYLDSLTARQRSDLAGVRDRLAILAESDVGCWLDPATRTAPRFEVLQAIRAGAVVYFTLDADRRPLLAQMLGAAVVQDLVATVAALQSRPCPALAVIDEFSALGAGEVVRLFGRARSAGLSLLLGTQELADLRGSGGERLLEQVVGNVGLVVAHRQSLPQSAELVAALAGKEGAWHLTRHSDGRSTRTRSRAPRLSADRIMSLRPGEAAMIGLGGGPSPRFVRIVAATRNGKGVRS
jgi:type IV secretory pathway TraG/TraD family ATPase VirD4